MSEHHDLNTSAGGRAYLSEFFSTQLKRHDFGRYIGERIAADFACALAKHLSETATQWRCFHCDETFTDDAAARLHFGTSLMHSPACTIDVAEYRAMEARMQRYNEEDSDLHREIAAMQSTHQTALRREEEKGYARGLEAATAALRTLDKAGYIYEQGAELWKPPATPDFVAGRVSGLTEAEQACDDKVREFKAREWVGDLQGAAACRDAIVALRGTTHGEDYKRLFENAVRSLAAIDNALGIDPDESGGAEPILEAIAELKAASGAPVAWLTTYECPPSQTVRILADMKLTQREYVMEHAKKIVELVPARTLKDEPPTVTRYV